MHKTITLQTLLQVKKAYKRGICTHKAYEMHIKAYCDKCNIFIVDNTAYFIKNGATIETINF